MACNLIFSNPGSQERTGTIYNVEQLPEKESCESVANTLDDLWCNNQCGNDIDYYIPVVEGQKLLIQTRFFDDVNFGQPEGNGNDCDELDVNSFRFNWRFVDNGYPFWGVDAQAGNLLGITIESANFGSYQTCQARLGGNTFAPLIAGATTLVPVATTPATSLSDYMNNKLVPFYDWFYNVNGSSPASATVIWTPDPGNPNNEGVLSITYNATEFAQSIPSTATCEANEWGEGCDCIDAFLQSRGNPMTLCDDEWLYWCPMNHRIGATYLVGATPADPNVVNPFIVSTWEGTDCCCEAQEEPSNCLSVGGGCGIGEGRASFEINFTEDPTWVYGTANQDIAQVNDVGFVIFLDGTPCNAITYDDVPVLQTLGAATDYNDFLNNVLTELTNFWTAIGTSTVTRNGDTISIEIDIDAYNLLYETEVCEDSFRVCTYNQVRPPEQGNATIVCDVDQDFFEFTLFFEHLQFQTEQPPITITLENDCGSVTLARILQFHSGDRQALLEEIYTSANGLLTGNSSVYPVDIPIYYWSGPWIFTQPEVRPEVMVGLRFRFDLNQVVNEFLCCPDSQPIITFNPVNPILQSPIPVNDNNYATNRMEDYITDIWTCCEETCPNENGFVSFDFNFGNYHKRDYFTAGVIDEIRIYWRTNNNIWTTPLLSDTLQYINTYNYSSLYDLLAYFMRVYNFDKSNWVNNGTFNPDGYLSLNGGSMKLHVPTSTFGVNDCENVNPVILFKYDNPPLQQF